MRMPARTIPSLCALVCLFAWVCAPAAVASVYKRVLPDGTAVYSDRPHPDAEAIEFDPVPTVEPFRARPQMSAPRDQRAPAPAGYERITITRPAGDDVIWSNEGTVETTVTTEPRVRASAGHRLVLLLDGEPVARGERGGRFVLQNVHRGTHALQAVVEDRHGETVARSEPVTFHLRQHSILAPGNPLRQPAGPGLPGRPPAP